MPGEGTLHRLGDKVDGDFYAAVGWVVQRGTQARVSRRWVIGNGQGDEATPNSTLTVDIL